MGGSTAWARQAASTPACRGARQRRGQAVGLDDMKIQHLTHQPASAPAPSGPVLKAAHHKRRRNLKAVLYVLAVLPFEVRGAARFVNVLPCLAPAFPSQGLLSFSGGMAFCLDAHTPAGRALDLIVQVHVSAAIPLCILLYPSILFPPLSL